MHIGKTGNGEEDESLTQVDTNSIAAHMTKYLPENSIVLLNLPLRLFESWRGALAAAGYEPMQQPFVVQQTTRKPAKWGLTDELVDNCHLWFGFRKKQDSPSALHPVKWLQEMYEAAGETKPDELSLLYRSGVTIKTHKVPAAERMKITRVGKKEFLRVQQLSGASVAQVLTHLVRTSAYNKNVIIVDPFVGAGGVLHAARKMDCYCVVADRDPECVDMLRAIAKVEFNDRGECLLELPQKGEQKKQVPEEGDSEEEGSPTKSQSQGRKAALKVRLCRRRTIATMLIGVTARWRRVSMV